MEACAWLPVLGPTVAALYVDPAGYYAGRDDVDRWDEERDAKEYAGPWPVVAHPPCERWGKLYWRGKGGRRAALGDDGAEGASELRSRRWSNGAAFWSTQRARWPGTPSTSRGRPRRISGSEAAGEGSESAGPASSIKADTATEPGSGVCCTTSA